MTTAERTRLRADAERLGAVLDEQAVERLDRFLDLLEVWNRRFRLTGDRERPTLLEKHVLDCLAVVPELPPDGPVVDIGSGAGFPGVVLACACPDRPVVLVEPRRRPTSFLLEVARTIPLPHVRVVEARAEDAARDPTLGRSMAMVVSRALRLDILVGLSPPFLRGGGMVVAMQTPSVSERDAGLQAVRCGLRLVRIRDYELPGGEARRLLVFEPIES